MPTDNDALFQISAQLADTASQAYLTGNASKRNRKFAVEMYDRQRSDALADWNMQNEYNSPAAQMARLKEAGINPFAIAGAGGSLMQASTVRSASMAGNTEMPVNGTNLGEAMMRYQNIKLANAQTSNVKAATEAQRAETAKKIVETFKTMYEGEHSKFDLQRKEELKKIIFEKGVADLDLVKASIDSTVHGNQRAWDLHRGNLSLQSQDIVQKKLQNQMQQMQNGQFEQLRPLEIAKLHSEIKQIKTQIENTVQNTKNTEQITKLNKMEADAGRLLQYLKTIIGGSKR